MKALAGPGHPTTVDEPSPPDGLTLVREALAGDGRAFRALYEAHFGFVYRTCRRLGLSPPDAEDAAQETFLVASRRLRDFTGGRLTTWLFRIAANLVTARHRRRRVREALFALWGRPDEREPDRPDAAFEAREAARGVAEVLARMAPKKREVFALFELEGLTGEEIAERVGCPLATVWTRLHHARIEFERIARRRGLTPAEEKDAPEATGEDGPAEAPQGSRR